MSIADFSADALFALLPAYMRVRDAAEGAAIRARTSPDDSRPPEDFGPLRTLASLVAREAQILNEAIDDSWANSFIETCAPWAIPYLGDLLGVQGLAALPPDAGRGLDLRARVADTLALRARRGTLRALAHAAATASGLPVLAVEQGRRLVHAQSLRLVHPAMGRAVDLRDSAALARTGGPFERQSRGVDVRRIDAAAPGRPGRANLGNVALQVWPLRPASLSRHAAHPVQAGSRMFRFHPLGCDAQLFDTAHALPPIDALAAGERDLPVAIRRAVMAEEPGRFYGAGRAIRLFVAGAEIPLAEIRVANLGDRAGSDAEPWSHRTAASHCLIDPELGRLVVGDNRPGPVQLSCHFARAIEIGGGEQPRMAGIGSVEGAVALDPAAPVAAQVQAAGGAGSFRITASTHIEMGAHIDVPAGAVLRIIAADGCFPTCRLDGSLEIALGAGARVELNGLRLHGGCLRVTGDATTPGELILRDCTLVPGHALDRNGRATAPGALTLQVAATGLALRLDRVVTGAIEIASDVEAELADCIVDAGSRAATAIAGAPAALRHRLSIRRCTIFGRVATDSFAGGADDPLPASSDNLFLGATPAIVAERRQSGCIRFSLVPEGALAPRLHRPLRGPLPEFDSVAYPDPGYFRLRRPTPAERAAENGDALGAENAAAPTARHDNIRRSISDFLRLGQRGGSFFQDTTRRPR